MVCFGEYCTGYSLRPLFTLIQAGILCKWTTDSKRLILESFDAIHNSPSYIYYYAIPFSPSSSWLHQNYPPELLQEVKVVAGLPAEWGLCSRAVAVDGYPVALASWKNTIAVGFMSGNIIFLNATTGDQMATLSGHTDQARLLVFSLDGTLLLSGSNDHTIGLWDVQTGGVVKTFNERDIHSISISSDCHTVASACLVYSSPAIHLWSVQTGVCYHAIQLQTGECYPASWLHDTDAIHIKFSPINAQCFISGLSGNIQQWNINGHKIGPSYSGFDPIFSPDGTQFAVAIRDTSTTLSARSTIMVQNTNTGAVVAELVGPMGFISEYCFSPDGKYIATLADNTIHIWNTTSSDLQPVEVFVHHQKITSLIFSPFLVSASLDKFVKFWEIGLSLADLVADSPISTPTSVPVKSITLQIEDGIAISSHSDGVVKTWDLSTGFCRASFQTPARGSRQGDIQLINKIMVFVWWEDSKIHFWDVEKGELLQMVDAPGQGVKGVRVSGDGSKVFCLDETSIQAWSISTGEAVGKVEFASSTPRFSLAIDDSRVWVHTVSNPPGWDFGIPGSSPIQLSNIPLSRPHLGSWENNRTSLKDPATKKEVLQLSGEFAYPVDASWDGRYLVAGYSSGTVLILDFIHQLSSRDP